VDFQQFDKSVGYCDSFDYRQLKKQLRESLEGYYLPVKVGCGKILNGIWMQSASVKEYIVVAWNLESPAWSEPL